MDDESNQAPGVDPLERAAHDQAAADRYQELADAELALRDALKFNSKQLSTYGFDEAAEKAKRASDVAAIIEDDAESGQTVYLRGAQAWTRVAEDTTEEAKLADQASAESAEEYGRWVDADIVPWERKQQR